MMQKLLQLAQQLGVLVLNGVHVEEISSTKNGVQIKTNNFEINPSRAIVTTNGFAQELLNEEVQPARAQVLITKPIENLAIKGTFHFDEGYYYFRNIDNRILFGGGRNLDFKTEETSDFGQTARIQNKLQSLLNNVILPEQHVEIDHCWSGIMGVGKQKSPIVKQISDHVFCGVRLGGMGVALGALVGKELVDFISNS